MDTHTENQNSHVGVAYTILKWTVFSAELVLLSVLLMVTFLVPVPPFPLGKLPQESFLVLLSAAAAFSTGVLFLRSTKSKLAFRSLIGTPPCVIGITVIAIVVIPIAVGLSRGR